VTFGTRRALAALSAAAVGIAVAISLAAPPGDHDADARPHLRAATAVPAATAAPAPDTTISVRALAVGRPIAPGFVGVSIEYSALSHYTGLDPAAVNPVFEQLLRNLSPGQTPQVRIGGNSSDSTWWPVPGMTRPLGINYTLTRRWLALARKLATDTGAQLTLGVDLEAGSPPLAATEARALLHGVGTKHVAALEIGNEPKRYALFPWYRNPEGQLVYVRPRNYSFAAFSRDFARAVQVMPAHTVLAGPTFSGRTWLSDLGTFMAREPRVQVITDHTYPLNRCWTKPGSPGYPTLSRLLSTYASRQLVAGLPPYAALAHRAGDIFRVDEMQSVACGGKVGVSDTMAASLWALDTLFSMARAGVDGVNLHTFQKAAYELFHFAQVDGRWQGTVSPEYYGLALFAQAAPPRSRLLLVRHAGSRAIRAWATRAPDGTVRVLLINDSLRAAHTLVLRQPLDAAAGSLIRLQAPSASATSGVTLGGTSFAPDTGRLGAMHATRLRSSGAGTLRVTVGAASAALVTLGPGGAGS
jgi:hypothetical protein